MDGSADRAEQDAPLVSIVMLAFNQQDLVGEAISSLLAQDYPRCELVVSDDNSTDGTFEAMHAAVAGYEGPMAIRLNRTTANRGTLSHFYEAVALSSGRLIVGAGGDDMSLPHRVSTLVAAWQSTGADALFSSCTVVDAEGNKMLDGTIWPNRAMQSYFPDRPVWKIGGAMAAYDRRVFETIPLPDEPVYCEDNFFSLLINYRRGRIEALPDRLVLYRNHQQSFTNSYNAAVSVEQKEVKARRYHLDNLAILRRFQAQVAQDCREGRTDIDVDMAAIANMADFHEFSANWLSMGPVERLRRATAFRSGEQLRWTLPRLFGLRAFLRLKALQRRIRRAP